MTPKQKSEEVPSGGGPTAIHCPACGSSITSDGRNLTEKSKKLIEWEEMSEGLVDIQVSLDKAENRIIELEAENAKLTKERGKVHEMEHREESPDDELER